MPSLGIKDDGSLEEVWNVRELPADPWPTERKPWDRSAVCQDGARWPNLGLADHPRGSNPEHPVWGDIVTYRAVSKPDVYWEGWTPIRPSDPFRYAFALVKIDNEQHLAIPEWEWTSRDGFLFDRPFRGWLEINPMRERGREDWTRYNFHFRLHNGFVLVLPMEGLTQATIKPMVIWPKPSKQTDFYQDYTARKLIELVDQLMGQTGAGS
jgi:hypothetical protein